MKKIILFMIVFCLAASLGQAQDAAAKGLLLPQKNELQKAGKTYALIVGISKYKDPAIPQLQYADRDAIAFRDYLVASGVDSNNIILRTNENAHYADIMLDLDDICSNKAKAGDKVFIYFSGHGDVESHVVTNDGYLLPYDAPKVVYAISAINVRILQTYVSTLSSKGVQVVVITDACHSGNLAGGLEGLKNIQTVLGGKWQDEIKILSCQPGELSLEGKQWGGGRGLFSYELINGLAGMADHNKDGKVTLGELNRYISDKVADGANPMAQNPALSGDMTAEVSKVNPALLASLSSGHSNELAAIDVKGFDEALLIRLDDTIKENYRLFKLYLDSSIFVRPSNYPSAYYYYSQIPKDSNTKILLGFMLRNLASEIISSSDKLLENFVSAEMNSHETDFTDKNIELHTLRNLLGDKKMRSLGMLSKELFFSACPFDPKDSANCQLAVRQIDSAITLDSTAAYLFLWKAANFNYLYPFADKRLRGAIPYLERAILLSPRFPYAYGFKAFMYRNFGEYDSSIMAGKELLKFGDQWKGEAYKHMASTYFLKAYFKDSTNQSIIDSADMLFTLILNDTINFPLRSLNPFRNFNMMGDFFKWRRNFPKAIAAYDLSAYLKPTSAYSQIGLAMCYALENNKEKAIEHLRKALEKNDKFLDYKRLKEETDLDNLRTTPEFKALMKKYFPDEYK